MREIKFRAWNKNNNTMNEVKSLEFIGLNKKEGKIGWLIGFFNSVPKGYPYPKKWQAPQYVLENSWIELMQFTGLKDKNGKEIYEGDISNITYTCMRFSHWMKVTDRGVMVWVEKSAQFSFEVKNSILNEEMVDLEVEIIGNIYENPELLNQPTI